MSKSLYITSLFVGGWFYWFLDEEDAAALCWRTAVEVIDMPVGVVGDA